MPFFSIIVPIYNAERYLRQCIMSVVGQTCDDWELILVNDGSKDSSIKICREYAQNDSRIIVVDKVNEGVSIARKKGAEISRGEYILFLDSDDWISKNSVEVLKVYLSKYNYDIIKFGAYTAYENKIIERPIRFEGEYHKADIQKHIFPILIQDKNSKSYTPSIWGSVYRRNIIEPYLIADKYAIIGEDSACVIPAVFHASSILFIKERLYYYRKNDSSVTNTKKALNWNNPAVIANHIENNIDVGFFDFKEQIYRRITHDLFNVSISQFYSFSYSKSKIMIKEGLSRDMYQFALLHAHYSGIKSKIMHVLIKNRVCPLLFIISRLKK